MEILQNSRSVEQEIKKCNFFSPSCQFHCFEHGLSWINSNHRSSKCWTTSGCSSCRGLEVVMLVSMFTDKSSFLLPLWTCWNLESSFKHILHKREHLEGWLDEDLDLLCVTALLPTWEKAFLHSHPHSWSMNSCWAHVGESVVAFWWGDRRACCKESGRQVLTSSFLEFKGNFNVPKTPMLAQLPFLSWPWSGLECG